MARLPTKSFLAMAAMVAMLPMAASAQTPIVTQAPPGQWPRTLEPAPDFPAPAGRHRITGPALQQLQAQDQLPDRVGRWGDPGPGNVLGGEEDPQHEECSQVSDHATRRPVALYLV